jgi:hypothetical protein
MQRRSPFVSHISASIPGCALVDERFEKANLNLGEAYVSKIKQNVSLRAVVVAG